MRKEYDGKNNCILQPGLADIRFLLPTNKTTALLALSEVGIHDGCVAASNAAVAVCFTNTCIWTLLLLLHLLLHRLRANVLYDGVIRWHVVESMPPGKLQCTHAVAGAASKPQNIVIPVS